MIRPFALLAASCLLCGGASAQGLLIPLLENGPSDQRVNIVFLSEGYRQAELSDRFVEDAEGILDYLLSIPPYESYPAYFNAFAIAVPSNESGSDHPSRNVFRDTYFSTQYDCAGIQRLICIGGDGYSRAQALLQQHVPDYDIVLIIVNDTEYGGSGGSFAVTSVDPSAAEIAVHEIGHSFAHLTDEYGGSELNGVEAANATQETRRDFIRWRHWIAPSTPLPTPDHPSYEHLVGLFEGASYNDVGWYRPQYQCKMRSLGVPFCAVCGEHHIRAIYDLVSPVAAYAPADERVTIVRGEPLALHVDPMDPADHALDIQWSVDGLPVEGAVNADFILETANLPDGGVVVSVDVRDGTESVLDPSLVELLDETIAWEVVPSGPTGREKPDPVMEFALGQNHPNPVRGATTFFFRLPAPSAARLEVFDPVGRVVAVVLSEMLPAGAHEVRWAVPGLPPGVYLYRLTAGGRQSVRKMIVVGR